MTLARSTTIRNVIVTELNHADRAWHLPAAQFTAAAAYAPIYSREDLEQLRVDVVALENEEGRAPESPKSAQDLYAINIVVQAAVDPADTTRIDELVYLCQQIHDFYELQSNGRPRVLTGLTSTWPAEVSTPEIYDPDKLVDERIFLSVVELVVRQWRKEAGGTP